MVLVDNDKASYNGSYDSRDNIYTNTNRATHSIDAILGIKRAPPAEVKGQQVQVDQRFHPFPAAGINNNNCLKMNQSVLFSTRPTASDDDDRASMPADSSAADNLGNALGTARSTGKKVSLTEQVLFCCLKIVLRK